jgi:hypothetical protein
VTRRSSFSTSLGLVAGLSRGGARRDGGWRVVPGPINSAERAAVASARGRFAAFLPVGLCRYARRVGSHGGDIIGAWELADRSPSMIDRPWHKRSPRRHRGRSAITPVAAGSPLHGTRAPRSNTSGLTFRFFHVSPPAVAPAAVAAGEVAGFLLASRPVPARVAVGVTRLRGSASSAPLSLRSGGRRLLALEHDQASLSFPRQCQGTGAGSARVRG